MIWLLPAAACSIAIAVILKINEGRGGNRLVLAGANYLVASTVALLLTGAGKAHLSAGTLALGAITGLDYVLSFLVLMAGIARGPLAVPVTVMRLSVAVPVVASIFIWKEQPAALQWGGIFLGLAAIVLFGTGMMRKESKEHSRGSYWPLMISIFLLTGLASILLRTFREVSPDTERLAFSWVLFTFAALFTWLIVLVRRIAVARGTFLLGMLLGLPNLFSTVFTLLALRSTPAAVVFPFINVTVIFGSTFLGYFVWKERLGRITVAALAAAAAALVLLSLK